MATVLHGIIGWEVSQDREGYREYTVKHKVRSTDGTDGPYNVLRTAGLPVPGSTWSFFNDIDPYAYCKQDATVKPMADEEENNKWWTVEQKFSNKGDRGHCKEDRIDNPLMQPQKVSGSFVKFQEEATHDRFGNRVLTSSHEQIRGPQNEWDANRPQIRIEQNVPVLQLELFTQMVDTVNQSPLWGLPPRTIKLSNVQWSANFYGSCLVYYTRNLEFDIRYRRVYAVTAHISGTGTALVEDTIGSYETFDRNLPDEGTKVLKGHWSRTTGRWVVDRIGILAPPSNVTAELSAETGSLPANTYRYKITSVNAQGESTASGIATIILASTGAILVTWDAVSGADSYNVYRSTGGGVYGKTANVTDPVIVDVNDFEGPEVPPTVSTAIVYPDSTNPSHFIRYQDRQYNTARCLLNGAGLPAEARISMGTGSGSAATDTTEVGNIRVERYAAADHLLLGIPTVLG